MVTKKERMVAEPAGDSFWGGLRRRLRGGWTGLIAGAVVGTLVAGAVLTWGESVRMDAADVMARSSLEKGKSPDITVVEIDEGTLAALANDYGRMMEWPRELYALVLDVLRKAGARRVVFDIIFDAPSSVDPGSDETFASAVRKAPDVALAANFLPGDVVNKPLPESERTRLAVPVDGRLPSDTAPDFATVVTGFEGLLTGAVDIGVTNQEADPDGVMRKIRPFYHHGGEVFAALGLAAVRNLSWKKAGAKGPGLIAKDGVISPLPVDHDGLLRLRFFGDRERYLGPSFARVLGVSFDIQQGAVMPKDFASEFNGKIVFVGVSAAALYDQKVTPISRWLPGVYVNATATEDVLRKRWLVEVPSSVTMILAVLFSAVGALAVRVTKWYAGAGAAVIEAAVVCVIAKMAFNADYLLDPVVPLAALWSGFTAAGVHRYLTEDYMKRKIRQAWGRYLSPEVIEELSKRDFEVEGLERGIRTELTVLFSDIVGFTSMSEKLSPEEVVSQLNEYLGVMSDVIRRNRGTLDKYIGDAIMAFWGEPLEDPEHAKHAVLAAVEMVEVLGSLQERWRKEGKKPFGIGIGINTGHAVVGHFGGAHRNYTVIGDEVNIASRLEGLTRNYDANIIVSKATADAVKDVMELEHIGEVQVKNREKPVDIYAVKGRKRNAGA